MMRNGVSQLPKLEIHRTGKNGLRTRGIQMKSSIRLFFFAALFVLASQASVFAMSQPTLPRCEGSDLTNTSSTTALIVYDNTPEFSAIVNFSWGASSENANIQVSINNSSWTTQNMMWDSGNKSITFVSSGTRCQDIAFGTLGTNGTLYNNLVVNTSYYWRVRFLGNPSFSPYVSDWVYGSFKTGAEFNHHYIYFKPSNAYDSPVGSFPYSSEDNWCKGLGNLSEIITAIVGDNNSNPSGTGTSSWDLASKQVNVTVVLDCGTGYVFGSYYKINEYNQQVFIDGRFVTSSSYFITVECSSDSKPVIQPGSSTDAVVINAPYTKVKNIVAQNSYNSGYSGFKAASENSNYITFDNCTARYNWNGFKIGTETTGVFVNGDNALNCTAYENDYAGFYVVGGAKNVDIYSCKAFDNNFSSSYSQNYGIKVEALGQLFGTFAYVNSCTIRTCELYNNTDAGIYISGGAWGVGGSGQAWGCQVKEFNKIYNNGVYGIYDGGYAGYSGDNALLIKNNIIWAGDNQEIGIRTASDYVFIINNTLYDHANAAVYQSGSSQLYSKFLSNIISIKDSVSSYGIYCNSASPFALCNYNDFHKIGSNGSVGFFDGADRTTLTAWYTATGYDSGSLAVDPKYVDVSIFIFNLKSVAGHWNDSISDWTFDAENSSCLDMGDPDDPAYLIEGILNGGRVNMGFEGGTGIASQTVLPTRPEMPRVPHCNYSNSPVTGITEPKPVFSAIFIDPETGDNCVRANIQVGTDMDWDNAEMWDSGWVDLASPIGNGSRIPAIEYDGVTLEPFSTYFWRIRLGAANYNENSVFSDVCIFVTADILLANQTITSDTTWNTNYAVKNLTIDCGATLTVADGKRVRVTGELNIKNGEINSLTTGGKIDIYAGTLIVDQNCKIDGKGKGHPATEGFGNGSTTSYGGGGAGYGGEGGDGYNAPGSGGKTYYNEWTTKFDPIYKGSGGGNGGYSASGGAGGGAIIIIEVANTCWLKAGSLITADGDNGFTAACGNCGGGAGSGGSVFIKAKCIKGSGTVSAKGGIGGYANGGGPNTPGGGGGGGRMAVYYAEKDSAFDWTFDYSGGAGGLYGTGVPPYGCSGSPGEIGTCVCLQIEPCIGTCKVCQSRKVGTIQSYQGDCPMCYNPVNGNVNFYESVLSPGGSDMNFSVGYNSLDPNSSSLGTHWTHSYNLHLVRRSCTMCSETESVYYTLVKECGARVQYAQYDGNQFKSVPWSGDYSDLDTSGGDYVLTQEDGRVLTFENSSNESVKRLTRIEDPNGNYQELSYDGEGHLETVASYMKTSGADTLLGTMFMGHSDAGRLDNVSFSRTASAGDVLPETMRKLSYSGTDLAGISTSNESNSPSWQPTYTDGLITAMKKPGSSSDYQVSVSDSLNGSLTAEFTDPAGKKTTIATDQVEQKYVVTDRTNYSREYWYDQRKNAVIKTRETCDTGYGAASTGALYTYDDNCNMTDSVSGRWNGDSLVEGIKSLRTYSSHGDVLRTNTLAWNGSGYNDNLSLTLYEYDNAFNMIKSQGPVNPSNSSDLARLSDFETTYSYGATLAEQKKHNMRSMTRKINGSESVVNTFAYDSAGHMILSTVDNGGLGLVTEYSYYSSTDVSSGYIAGLLNATVVDPAGLGIINRQIYTSVGQTWKSFDPRYPNNAAYATEYFYNVRGELIKTKSPSGVCSHSAYNESGLLDNSWTSNADDSVNGPVSKNYYNSLGRLESSDLLNADDLSDVVSKSYYYADAEGRQLRGLGGCSAGDNSTYLSWSETEYYLNGMVEKSRVKLDDSDWAESRNFYDAQGRLDEVETEGGSGSKVRSKYVYNSLGQMTAVISDFGGENIEVNYEINVRGETAKVTGPRSGQETEYGHDFLGRVVVVEQAMNSSATITSKTYYDKAGRQVATQFDPSGLNILDNAVYDAAGRVIHQFRQVGSTVYDGSFTTYNADGSVANQSVTVKSSTDARRQVSYDYDADGRMFRQTVDPDGLAIETLTHYDPLGRAFMTTADPGGENQSSVNVFNGAGQVAKSYSISKWMDADNDINDFTGDAYKTVFSYDRLGRAVLVTDANGKTTRTVYDFGGRVTDVFYVYVDEENFHHKISYEYDLAGNRTKVIAPAAMVTNPLSSTVAETEFTFDQLSRLTAINYSAPGPDESYSYDDSGNMATKADGSGRVSSYTYNYLNQLVLIDFADLADRIFAYDFAGRLIHVSDGGTDETYSYDHFGNLINKTDHLYIPAKEINYGYFEDGALENSSCNGYT
jgi:YD repeat-containing protein